MKIIMCQKSHLLICTQSDKYQVKLLGRNINIIIPKVKQRSAIYFPSNEIVHIKENPPQLLRT